MGCTKPSAVYRNRMQRYPDEVWLIWSNKRGCWYAPDCCGYTTDIARAGLYDRAKAAEHYCGPVAKKYRDVEPFPLSSVKAMMQRRIEAAHAEIASIQALVAALGTAPAPPKGSENG